MTGAADDGEGDPHRRYSKGIGGGVTVQRRRVTTAGYDRIGWCVDKGATLWVTLWITWPYSGSARAVTLLPGGPFAGFFRPVHLAFLWKTGGVVHRCPGCSGDLYRNSISLAVVSGSSVIRKRLG
ncbi:hypothetical protein Hesp01_35270 [Herbidospora sp. NBRC 101105]|nr:hypothetical protein Hesp01_35270 [Herbidospora sp. NBRC 101105]